MRITLPFVALTALFILSTACSGDQDPGSKTSTTLTATFPESGTFGEGTTSAGSDPTSMTTPTTVTTTPTTGDATTAVDPTTEADPSLPETITATVTTEVDDTGPVSDTEFTTDDPNCGDQPPNQPQDSTCSDASGCGCASNKCFIVPFFNGTCGECLGDADCDGGGCTAPNPIQGLGAVCNNGEAGAGCETSAVCADPNHDICAKVLDVPGILTVATCSACADNGDCPANAANCTPVYDIQGFTGVLECVPDGFVPDGQGCSLTPDNNDDPLGDEACASGSCGAADIMGVFQIGVCGECNSDLDCQMLGLDSCDPPQVDINSGDVFPATCF